MFGIASSLQAASCFETEVAGANPEVKKARLDLSRKDAALAGGKTSANGRFKTGQTIEVGAEGIGVYNTMLRAMGTSRRLGPDNREGRPVDIIRA